jgi:thymidylate kinase
MYLEFAGLPGSGKSTLSSALELHLKTLSCHALARHEAIRLCIKRRNDGVIKNILKRFPSRIWWPFVGSQFALPEYTAISSRHLKFVSFMSQRLSESNLSEAMIESIWNTIVRSFYELQLVSQHIDASELVIMDEAFSQRSFTLFGYTEKTVPDKFLFRYAALAPISNQVFWIVTSPEICVNRFMQRYQSRPLPYDFQLDHGELLDNFQSGNTVLERLCKTLESQGKCVHRISGDKDINESIAAIKKIVSPNWLEQLHHESRH